MTKPAKHQKVQKGGFVFSKNYHHKAKHAAETERQAQQREAREARETKEKGGK